MTGSGPTDGEMELWRLIAEGEMELDRMIDEAIAERDYETALMRMHKGDRLPTLLEWWDELDLTPDEWRRLFAFVWTDTESARFHADEVVAMLRWIAPVVDGEAPPPGVLTVYRGVSGDGDASGISWTLDLERARWFARRFDFQGSPRVYRARVAADDVLAFLNDRKEREVVVDPATLVDVELVEVLEGGGES